MKQLTNFYNYLSSRPNIFKVIGLLGFVACAVAYALYPSFPTPDKILVFIILGAMIFSQGVAFTLRFVPFILILYVYEAFRGLAHILNNNVNFTFMIEADKVLFFGHLPTELLQKWWWNGQVQWYDFVFYLAYMAHFVMPLILAVVIWKKFTPVYWRFVATYAALSFAGFATYLLFPAAPPWMASDLGYIESIQRISSDVWYALGVHDFATFYSQVSPNPVAAVPSLHSAYALLFPLFVVTLFKSKYRHIAWVYPILIGFGTVYQGEHYAIDAILGWIYALAAFYGCLLLWPKISKNGHEIRVRLFSYYNTKIKFKQ